MTSADGDDFLAIRWMAYFALSFDHRVIDGADAERFLAFVKEQLESGDFSV
jgi:2-oxoglutarate dehydrogenase E2 component (dihydrolipoamide succinyltransferase)